MDWEKYDSETEQQIEQLCNILPWNTMEQAWESATSVGALSFRREVDKEVLKDLISWTEKEKGKRLRYKHNKKRKFKKWHTI